MSPDFSVFLCSGFRSFQTELDPTCSFENVVVPYLRVAGDGLGDAPMVSDGNNHRDAAVVDHLFRSERRLSSRFARSDLFGHIGHTMIYDTMI